MAMRGGGLHTEGEGKGMGVGMFRHGEHVCQVRHFGAHDGMEKDVGGMIAHWFERAPSVIETETEYGKGAITLV